MMNINPVALTIFGRPIYWYGILISLAVLLGIVLAYREAKRKGWNPDHILDFALLAVPLAIVCARIYYVVFEWQRYAANPISALYIWQGGIAIYGAVIGGVLAAVIFCKWRKKSLWQLLDICAPSLVLGQCIGRWGNFFNQEAYGYQVASASQEWFPFAVQIQSDGAWHYATFFYESLACLLIFLFLLWYKRRSKTDGNVFLFYLLLYGIERAFVEGLRTDSLYIGGVVRVSQVLSVVLVIVSLVLLIQRRRRAVLESGEVDPRLAMLHRESDDDEEDALADEASAAPTDDEDAPEDTAPADGEPADEDAASADDTAAEDDAPAQEEALADSEQTNGEDAGDDTDDTKEGK